MLQVLEDVHHFIAGHWLDASTSITKELYPSPDLFVTRTELKISIIGAKLVFETLNHGCDPVFGIK